MIEVLRSTWPLFVGIAFSTLSYGLQVPLVPVRAFDEGFDTSITGLIMAGYFFGVLLGAIVTPRLIQHVGHTKVFAALASIASGTPLLYTVHTDPTFWILLRVVTGLCMGALFIVAETWLNDRCTNQTRGKVLNLYFMIMLCSAGLGALMLNLADPRGVELFILSSVLVSFGIVPILLTAKPAPSYRAPKRLGVVALARKAPLGLGAFAIWGMADGTLMASGPIYADKAGLSNAEIATFMAVIYLGCLIFMWPIGQLSDRLNRPRFLLAVSLAAAAVAVVCALTPPQFVPLLYGLTALLAGLSLAHYGLCLAVANDQLEPKEMVGAGATLFLCYGVGTVIGPILATELMEAWRAAGFFAFLAGVHLLVVLYGLALMLLGAVGGARRQPAVAVPSLAGQLATESALESAREADRGQDDKPAGA
ncbi:MAG: MFS transporter [Pseudomonadota bacterium]